MSNSRESARKLLDEAVPPNVEIRSNGATAAKFTELTGGGYTHKLLTDSWAAGKNLTCCNGFTGWYGQKMGSKTYLGVFDLKAAAEKAGKPAAWVASAADNRPAYGDIVRYASFHVDVCAGFDGDVLLRVAGGQGGKALGYDIIKRVRSKGPYDPKKVLGWLDIESYFDSASASTSSNGDMAWLAGWWEVTDGEYYYYFFSPTGTVQYTMKKPASHLPPSPAPLYTGKYSYSSPGTLIIDWHSGDGGSVRETFRDVFRGATTMRGTSNLFPPLKATKMR